ncbi:hypothetical protein [Streptomyces sp. NPDC094466]|uniref:hypothetical protein n=1 Tax=Streptomyces sp. NPDC094466 TaxID=3366065 RepID=UPI0037F32887
MNDQPMEIMVLPERPAVRNDQLTEFDVVIEIRCHAVEGTDRSGGAMNLCLVIDRSGSMAGQDKLGIAVLAQGAAIGSMRVAREVRYIGKKRQMGETYVLVVDLAQDYLDEPEVQDLMNVFRKSVRHEGQRNQMHVNSVNSADDEVEVTLLVSALGVADRLIERFPADRAILEAKRESLRERLASLT